MINSNHPPQRWNPIVNLYCLLTRPN